MGLKTSKVWKKVIGYEDIYEVSEFGEVRRTDKKYGETVKPYLTNSGYLQVYLRKPNFKRKHKYIHKIVAEAYIPNPSKLKTVNHKDGNKKNNAVSNLEWVTRSQNVIHAYHDLKLDMGWRKIPVVCIETNEMFCSISEAERKTGIKTISKCISGKCKTSGGLHWERA